MTPGRSALIIPDARREDHSRSRWTGSGQGYRLSAGNLRLNDSHGSRPEHYRIEAPFLAVASALAMWALVLVGSVGILQAIAH